MKLSILIPTIRRHDRFLTILRFELASQILPYAPAVEILVDDNETDSIGTKRNRLLNKATGEYVCFIDSDDYPSVNYIELLMKAIESGCDCASLKGVITFDGKDSAIFEHSIKYKEWRTVPNSPITYERYPNHLNCIRASIAKKFKFPEISHGEDHNWSKQLHESGMLKTEFYIDQVLYYYHYLTKK